MNLNSLSEFPSNIDIIDAQTVVGPDLIASIDATSTTLFRRRGLRLELIGSFDDPAAAWAVLDLDDPAEATMPSELTAQAA
jgi:hypothetical protein